MTNFSQIHWRLNTATQTDLLHSQCMVTCSSSSEVSSYHVYLTNRPVCCWVWIPPRPPLPVVVCSICSRISRIFASNRLYSTHRQVAVIWWYSVWLRCEKIKVRTSLWVAMFITTVLDTGCTVTHPYCSAQVNSAFHSHEMVKWASAFGLLMLNLRYRDSVDNTAEDNSSVFSLIQMHWLLSARACRQ